MKLFVWISAALSVFAAVAGPATAQVREALNIEDLLGGQEFAQMSEPALSPDQRLLVYSVKRKAAVTERTASAVSSLFMYLQDVDLLSVDTQTLESKCIVCGEGNNGAPVWSPDGQYLAFLSERDASSVPSLWVWERQKNTVRKISDLEARSFELQWRNNTELVCLTRSDTGVVQNGSALTNHNVTTKAVAEDKPSVTVFHSTTSSTNPQSSAPWNLDGQVRDLTVIDVRTGRVRRLVAGLRVAKFAVSPDGEHIAFSSPLNFERPGSQQIRWDLIAVTIATKEQHKLASDVRLEYDGSPFSWSPDSSRLSYLAGGPLERHEPDGRGDCFVIDVKTGRTKNMTNFSTQPHAGKQRMPVWEDKGNVLYFIRDAALWSVELGHSPRELSRVEDHRILELASDSHGHIWSVNGSSLIALTYSMSTKASGFYRIDLRTGEQTKLREEGCYDCINTDDHIYVVPHGDSIAYFMEDASHEPNLWLADATLETRRQLTQLNPKFDKYEMGRSQLVEWRSLDGRQLQGALLLPPDYRKDRRYPLVVWNYPGNRGSDNLNHFGLATGGPFNMQILATRGYAVLYPDIPETGASMRDIANNVLPGINRLIEIGIADPNRLGVMGHSFGGYGTVALIAENRNFKAAVEIDGFSNLVTHYGQLGRQGSSDGVSVAEMGQQQLRGTPWQVRDKYVENSPYFYLDRIESPLLIVHGADDSAVQPFLADELFVALRRLGKEVEYARYAGEGHSPVYWNRSNQVDFCRRVVRWFDQHLDSKGN